MPIVQEDQNEGMHDDDGFAPPMKPLELASNSLGDIACSPPAYSED